MGDLIAKLSRVAFDKRKSPSMFLTNFFNKVPLDGIKVELQSRTVKSIYSVDVKLGTGGRVMDFSKYDKKEYTVPEYNDYAVITEEDMCKVPFGYNEYSDMRKAATIADRIADKQILISDAQRRAEEKQASDGLFTGVVTLADKTKIEFNKKATHTIDKASAKWNSTDGNPVEDIKDACKLCRDDGKIGTSLFHLIMEDDAFSAMLSNEKFIKNANAQSGIDRTKIGIPEEMTPGATFQGQFAVGSNKINVWTYNEKYEIPTGYGFANEGTEVGYIPRGCAVLIPDKPKFERYYGAVNNVNADTKAGGEKLNLEQVEQLPYAYDVVNHGSAITEAGVKSRPLVVPVDVDSFATFKNLV